MVSSSALEIAAAGQTRPVSFRHGVSAPRLLPAVAGLSAGQLLLTSLWLFTRPSVGSLVSLDYLFSVGSGLLLLLTLHVIYIAARASDSERRYRALFERSLDCLFLIDPDGDIIDANQPALSLLGYCRRDLGKVNFRDLVVPEQIGDAAADIQLAFADAPNTEVREFTLRRQDGGLVEVESRLTPVSGGGRTYAVQGIARDITERKRKDRALHESESRFRQIAEGIPQVFWLAPPDYQSLLYVSPAFEQIWGRSIADLMASPLLWLDAVHPDDRPHVLNALEDVAAGTPYDIDFRIIRPDGSERWINDRAYAVLDENGHVSLTTGIATDITNRRHAEEQLRLASTVFEHSHEAILIAGPDNQILSVNRAFSEITGYQPAEVIGATPAVLKSGRQDKDFYDTLWAALRQRGHWAGMIWNRRKTGEVFPEWLAINEVRGLDGELTHRVGIFSDISERVASEDRIQHLAQFDSLTDLPNRLLLTDRIHMGLAQAQRQQHRAAVLFLDLDRFKLINDTLGHDIGDGLLQCVAGRLREMTRATDTVSRYGGDEFVLFLTAIDTPADAVCVAEQALRILAEPMHVAGHDLCIRASIGVSIYPDHGEDMTTLLRHADAAMYAAKESGGDQCQFYAEVMNARAAERLSLEYDLRLALERNELFVAYQPQVALATGEIVGIEALARWRHPTAGLISPDRFIPVAEETGLIVPLDQWLMRTACRQLAEWKHRRVISAGVAVNVSPIELHQAHFRDDVARILAEEHLSPGDVELEVTEGAMAGGAETLLPQLENLKRLGVRLAIDDFGTGYSSLSHLRQLPLHRLKIDRSFVTDLPGDKDAAAIALAIVQMGHSLGLSVIAEGVETEDQAAYLRSIGCDDAQGYLFGAPLSGDAFERWLKHRPRPMPDPCLMTA
jgi:diguanylate cyclase (GGDEF)-like protein/PAS domain S-box-containing protein